VAPAFNEPGDARPDDRHGLRGLAVAVAAVGIGAATLAAAPAASASSSHWGTIEGIGGVNVRDYWGGLSAPVIGHANNQDHVTVYCYVISNSINGDAYWDLLDDPNGYNTSDPSQPGVTGFVADTYVYTGGNVNTQVPHCSIPPG
jgi:hypothetical protein